MNVRYRASHYVNDTDDRKELPMLPDLNPRQLRARTGIYRVHPRLAGSLGKLEPRMHIMLMHIRLNVCRRGQLCGQRFVRHSTSLCITK